MEDKGEEELLDVMLEKLSLGKLQKCSDEHMLGERQ
jgi:hypothetical protein